MRRVIAAALLLIASSAAAMAQPEPAGAVSLTLDDAIRRGLEASHRLAEAIARGEAAAAAADQRHAAQLPQVAAQAGYMRTNHVQEFGVLLPNNQLRIIYPDIPDNYHTRLDVQWPLYTGGRLAAFERAARTEAAALSNELDAARADLRLEVTRAYWTLLTAAETVRVVDESLARTRAHLVDARNLLEAGVAAPNDVLTVEAQESRQRMLSIQARANRDVAEAELGRLVGVPPGTPVDPVTALDPPAAESADLGSLVEIARQGRPERAALLKRLESATDRGKAAAAATRPTVGVAGGFDYARPNPRIFPRQGEWAESWDAGINVNWPLFDGGRARAEAAEAAALARAAQTRVAEFDAVLAVELRQRVSELESGRAAIAAAADAVRAATEARRVAGERFAAGVASSTDVLDAQVAVLQAALDRTQAVANARLAEARLARALGR
jgi:outer membrane protein TolC